MVRLVVSALTLLGVTVSSFAANPNLVVTPLGSDLTTTWKYTVSATGSFSGDVYSMTAAGHDIYWCADRGGFAYVEATGDFTFSCRLKTAPSNSFSKVGINVRETLSAYSRAIDLRWDYNLPTDGKWCYFYRSTPGSGTDEKGSCTQSEGAFADITALAGTSMKFERKGATFTLSLKSGSGSWQTVKSGLLLVTSKVQVGPSLASGAKGSSTATAEWDQFVFTTTTSTARQGEPKIGATRVPGNGLTIGIPGASRPVASGTVRVVDLRGNVRGVVCASEAAKLQGATGILLFQSVR